MHSSETSSSETSSTLVVAELPIKKNVSTAFIRSLNSVKKLLKKNGFLSIQKASFAIQNMLIKNGLQHTQKEARVFCVFLDYLNEELIRNFQCIYNTLSPFNHVLMKNETAFHQLVYYLKLCKADKHLWKKVFSGLVFSRKKFPSAWLPPPKRRKRKKKNVTKSTKQLSTLPFLLSFYKLLKEARENGDTKGANELMQKFRKALPFGSTAFLLKGLHQHNKNHEHMKTLKKEQRKLKFCSFVKIGRNKRERMAEEHFCVKHRRYLSKFRVPEKIQENSMEQKLKNTQNSSSSESEEEEW